MLHFMTFYWMLPNGKTWTTFCLCDIMFYVMPHNEQISQKFDGCITIDTHSVREKTYAFRSKDGISVTLVGFFSGVPAMSRLQSIFNFFISQKL